METKVAIIGIIVENMASVPELNKILHEHNTYIIGRMGLPYRAKSLHVISIVLDASLEVINKLAETIGHLNGVSIKTAYAGCNSEE